MKCARAPGLARAWLERTPQIDDLPDGEPPARQTMSPETGGGGSTKRDGPVDAELFEKGAIVAGHNEASGPKLQGTSETTQTH